MDLYIIGVKEIFFVDAIFIFYYYFTVAMKEKMTIDEMTVGQSEIAMAMIGQREGIGTRAILSEGQTMTEIVGVGRP